MKSSSRLKNFCQLCRKQCRDQNGYACHINSTSHQRKAQQFKTNPQQLIEKYSQQMQGKFIHLLKSKYPGEPKHLQIMYNQYEQEAKRFIKFSHTKWKNLKQFGEYLSTGDVKNIKVTGVSPDCYITYTVNKTMEFIQKNKKEQLQALRQKEKQLFEKSLQNRIQRQKAYELRQASKFQQQMRKVQKQRENVIIPDKLQFHFDNWGQNGKRSAFITAEQLEKQALKQQNQTNQLEVNNKKLVNNEKLLNQIISKEQRKQQKKSIQNENNDQVKQNSADDQVQWVMPGIIVKIKPHDIDPAFHNRKTKILQIVEPYVAKIHVGTATLQVDQSFLQTVIPKIGNQVMILYGEKKGQIGELKEVDLTGGFGNIQIDEKTVKIPFNYFSKFEDQ